jgi:predicted unusual protein kinase regulating ubiquinone biosynthesis (AarF/ABC1/UbiB family)
MVQSKLLPAGRIGRIARMAGLGARTGASLLLSRDGKRAAQQAAEVLGSLRGLAAKVGQMASYVDGLVPEAHRDAYELALKGLRAAAPSSPPEAIAELVERELGAPIDRLFSEWTPEPIAAASIGQVHRARLADGRAVAVKVQHPGIERAVESDLQNAGVLEGLIGALGPRAMNSKQVFDEVARRFREELDYRIEADNQRRFLALFAGDPQIRIPQVHAERSSQRVLTTELCSGISLEEASLCDEALRARYCEVLWRFVYRGIFHASMFNADPHPGNYLFGPDGTITFLDFGCVHSLSTARMRLARAMHDAARRRDEPAWRSNAVQLMQTRGGAYEEDVARYMRRCFEPLFGSPFRISRAYASDMVRGAQELKKHMFSGDGSFTPFPEGMVFMSRLQFGFYSVLARLDACVDYAAIEEQFLTEHERGVHPQR